MAGKSHNAGPEIPEIVEQWRRERNSCRRRKSDPLAERIQVRRERIRKRVGLLDDSVLLIRERR
jgi:hypothetical protein